MAILEILEYPDPRLRTKAKEILPEEFDDALQKQIDDMFETMYAAPGIGLAATQVDYHKRLFIIDISEDKSEPWVFINPEIVEKRDIQTNEEGCLSFPGVYAKVDRAKGVKVKALDRNGEPFEIDNDEFLAIVIQHENDHIDGKVFVDYLSPLKQRRIRNMLEKQQKKKLRAG
ncbi:MAG: peptide deformylase [Gammaproteobacteria bacterium]|nr:peptide deformylase [Gammaproteobacteria bacterium]